MKHFPRKNHEREIRKCNKPMKKHIILTVMAGTFFAGCNSMNSKSLAANAIGCPEEDIRVANEIASAEHLQHWLATCKGVKYVCNYHQDANVSCKEATDQVMEYEDQDD